mmetsp:Transcript_17888/g.15799  ORF Transcript_17888/g.15799 Transcript_17888/m.15799 type:complete len:235 (+) Transcript_17888:119-823(+)
MFKSHAYVGMINYDQVLIQHETCLLIANINPLMKEYFYQQCLYNFQNFGKFNFSEPLDIEDLLRAGLDFPEIDYCETSNMSKKELVQKYLKRLNSPMVGDSVHDPEEPTTKDMLAEYFKITIKDNKLYSLPKVVKEIPPFIDYLPILMVKLAHCVDYTQETNCFKQISEIIAEYFSKFIYYYALNNQEKVDQDCDKQNNVEFILKNILLPRMKKGLKIRARFGTEVDKTFTTIT